ncbi:hypothetical protein SAMN05216483_2821 [Streptomyces sp. 2131.1]|uniref:hypothetical protein n=1 Tax=Streptomyces sp. 2131.1 TaxID=1855346 RepID=UPI00089C913A|nr:hypothetical protein [Streptomyces sp. 2131.1]SEC98183.1 hypothetical protein SAMN05216483_2821 [Streptomyces sp. 2131.1]
MLGTVADHSRPLRRAAAAVGAVALIAVAAAPASADNGRVPGDLVLGPLTSVAGAKIGSVVEVPALFANKGDKALEKIFLTYGFSQGLAFGGTLSDLPSNCALRGSDIESDAGLVLCELEQTVKAGGIYAPPETLPLKVLGEALNENVSVMVSTYDPVQEGSEKAWPGTGPAMQLTELPPTTPVGDGDHPSRTPSGDQEWDSTDMSVDAVNTADLQMALREKSRAGKTLTLEATFSNAGPGEVKHYDSETSLTKFLFKAPAGTTVTKIDNRCRKVTTGSYNCVPYTHPYLWVGATDSFAVTLRVDKAVPGAKASASLENKPRFYDKNKKNDSATLLINKDGGSTGGTGTTDGGTTDGGTTGGHTTGGSSAGGGSTGGDGSTSSTGGSTGTGGSGSTGGSATGGSATTGSSGASATGGNLASTGSGATLPLAGAAAATLAVGAGAVLLVRRRAARS